MPAKTRETERWESIEAAYLKAQSMAAAGEFAASIMHEINNPLEAISNLSYIVISDPELPESTRKYMALLEEQLTQVRQIVGKTLGFFRPASTRQTIDISELAGSALRLHEAKIRSKAIQLKKRFKPGIQLDAHSGELLQVISNLIANSIDALPVGGTLHLRICKTAENVHVTIADNGHGIAPNVLPMIFESFFTTKQQNGTGLGLGISKAIIEKHGGRMSVRTSVRDLKSGTAFRMSFPS